MNQQNFFKLTYIADEATKLIYQQQNLELIMYHIDEPWAPIIIKTSNFDQSHEHFTQLLFMHTQIDGEVQ